MNNILGKVLDASVAIAVPSTVHNEALSETAYRGEVEQALIFLSDLFGGATAINATGGWLYEDGKLGTEAVTVVISFTDDLTPDKVNKFLAYADRMRNRLKQEAVLILINGHAVLR